MSGEVANVILSSQSTTNPPSYINAQKTNFIFSNVNLKNLLGEMWEKYDKFIIKPISIYNTATIALSSTAYNLVIYNMKGLSWTNINYETTPGSKLWAPLFQTQVPTTGSTSPVIWYANNGWGYTFRKASPIVDLEFAISVWDSTEVGGSNLPVAGNNYGDTIMQFTIEPVVKGYNECAAWIMNINPTLSTANGRYSTNPRTYTYGSFNLRDLCREFWDDYEDFEILQTFTLNRGSYVGTTANQIAPLQLSGFGFENSLTKQGNNTDYPNSNYSQESPIVASIQIPTSGSQYFQNTSNPFPAFQFKKSTDSPTISWAIREYDNTGLTSATNPASTMIMGYFIRPTYGVEKGSLYLNSWGLTTTNTNLGVRNAGYTSITLKNIDFSLVCKTFWRKYMKYNIYLTGFAPTYGSGNVGAEGGLLKMSGLDFINQTTIQTSNNTQNQIATLGVVNLSASATTVMSPGSYNGTIVTSFYRTKDIFDLTLTIEQVGPTAFTGTPLLGSFTFTIVPVKE